MAEQRVSIEGMFPASTSLPVSISGTLPPGTAIPVALAAPAASSAPVASSILATSVTAAGTLMNLSAGQIWYGYFTLSSTLIGTSKTAIISIGTTGGTASPPAAVEMLSLNLATGTLEDSVNQAIAGGYLYIHAGASAATVDVTVTGNPAVLSATAYGYILS